MTPQTFKQIRQAAGMSQSQLMEWLGLKDKRIIGRYEQGEVVPSGPVTRLMTLLDRGILSADYWDHGAV
jgi:DNA-binding transcriptional regulator YiaG